MESHLFLLELTVQINETRLLIKLQNATIISSGEIVNIELLGDRG